MRHPVTGMTVVEYVAPPKPEDKRVAERDRRSPVHTKWRGENRRKDVRRKTISVPLQEGTPVTTLTVENGMTIHLHRESWDWAAADHYAKAASDFLADRGAGGYLGFPSSQRPDEYTWVSRHTLSTMMHFHDQISVSPVAIRKMGGKEIVVAGKNDLMALKGRRQ